MAQGPQGVVYVLKKPYMIYFVNLCPQGHKVPSMTGLKTLHAHFCWHLMSEGPYGVLYASKRFILNVVNPSPQGHKLSFMLGLKTLHALCCWHLITQGP